MKIRVLDSETCGFVGPMVLLQHYRVNSVEELKEIKIEDVNVLRIWETPICISLDVISEILEDIVVGFNLTYDWFHLTKIYNLLLELSKQQSKYHKPDIDLAIKLESTNPSKYCLRPREVIDLMLYAQRGPYQSAMKRKDLVIRKVPQIISGILAEELTAAIPMQQLYFYNKPYRWEVINEENGFADIRLRFHGSTKLNAIAQHRLGKKKGDWIIPTDIIPTELEYIPFGQYGDKPWGKVIKDHIAMWHITEAEYYARQDIVVTGELAYAFNEDEIKENKKPLIDVNNFISDDDSFLACMVGATRVKGFNINKKGITELYNNLLVISKQAPKAPKAALRYLHELANVSERAIIKSTDKKTLLSLAKWESTDGKKHPVANRASKIFEARKATKRLELLDKIKKLPSYHPVFKIIGTKSSRLSGGSDSNKSESINPQGIPRDENFRKIFTLAYDNERLHLGDADSFEVVIMAADFNDPILTGELRQGKKFHALIWSDMFELQYEEILQKKNKDTYNKAKLGTFSWAYGGQLPKIAEATGSSEEKVSINLEKVNTKYRGIANARDSIYNDFCSMRQPNGIGTAVIWHEPKDYCESLLGFRRYFTLENYVCKSLFNFANRLPRSIKTAAEKLGAIKVKRRDREQSIAGAIQSALYACAFNIQASNLRQAGNHRIQSTGGQITKGCQRSLYEYQPVGIHEFVIRVINVHDELLSVDNGTVDVPQVMSRSVNKYRKWVPLLKWDMEIANSWADK